MPRYANSPMGDSICASQSTASQVSESRWQPGGLNKQLRHLSFSAAGMMYLLLMAHMSTVKQIALCCSHHLHNAIWIKSKMNIVNNNQPLPCTWWIHHSILIINKRRAVIIIKYLTIIPRACVGYEMIDSQWGAKRWVGYNHLTFNKRKCNNYFIKNASR